LPRLLRAFPSAGLDRLANVIRHGAAVKQLHPCADPSFVITY
jgi:hypothetical protein